MCVDDFADGIVAWLAGWEHKGCVSFQHVFPGPASQSMAWCRENTQNLPPYHTIPILRALCRP